MVQILSIIDTPKDFELSKSSAIYMEKVKDLVEEKKSIEDCFSASNLEVRDLLRAMLKFDPKQRLNAEELLKNILFDPVR
jgi:hypothetical protein